MTMRFRSPFFAFLLVASATLDTASAFSYFTPRDFHEKAGYLDRRHDGFDENAFFPEDEEADVRRAKELQVSRSTSTNPEGGSSTTATPASTSSLTPPPRNGAAGRRGTRSRSDPDYLFSNKFSPIVWSHLDQYRCPQLTHRGEIASGSDCEHQCAFGDYKRVCAVWQWDRLAKKCFIGDPKISSDSLVQQQWERMMQQKEWMAVVPGGINSTSGATTSSLLGKMNDPSHPDFDPGAVDVDPASLCLNVPRRRFNATRYNEKRPQDQAIIGARMSVLMIANDAEKTKPENLPPHKLCALFKGTTGTHSYNDWYLKQRMERQGMERHWNYTKHGEVVFASTSDVWHPYVEVVDQHYIARGNDKDENVDKGENVDNTPPPSPTSVRYNTFGFQQHLRDLDWLENIKDLLAEWTRGGSEVEHELRQFRTAVQTLGRLDVEVGSDEFRDHFLYPVFDRASWYNPERVTGPERNLRKAVRKALRKRLSYYDVSKLKAETARRTQANLPSVRLPFAGSASGVVFSGSSSRKQGRADCVHDASTEHVPTLFSSPRKESGGNKSGGPSTFSAADYDFAEADIGRFFRVRTGGSGAAPAAATSSASSTSSSPTTTSPADAFGLALHRYLLETKQLADTGEKYNLLGGHDYLHIRTLVPEALRSGLFLNFGLQNCDEGDPMWPFFSHNGIYSSEEYADFLRVVEIRRKKVLVNHAMPAMSTAAAARTLFERDYVFDVDRDDDEEADAGRRPSNNSDVFRLFQKVVNSPPLRGVGFDPEWTQQCTLWENNKVQHPPTTTPTALPLSGSTNKNAQTYINDAVHPKNLEQYLEQYLAPGKEKIIEFVKIDIDSYDYEILQGVKQYAEKKELQVLVYCLEVNGLFHPPVRFWGKKDYGEHELHEDEQAQDVAVDTKNNATWSEHNIYLMRNEHQPFQGLSLQAVVDLLRDTHSFVWHRGEDAYFVHNELVKDIVAAGFDDIIIPASPFHCMHESKMLRLWPFDLEFAGFEQAHSLMRDGERGWTNVLRNIRGNLTVCDQFRTGQKRWPDGERSLEFELKL